MGKKKRYEQYLQCRLYGEAQGDQSIIIEGHSLPFIITRAGEIYGSSSTGIHKLQPIQNNDGFLQVTLECRAGTWVKLIHELVAIAYLPNPDSLSDIRHRDDNKLNNHYTNLEWYDSPISSSPDSSKYPDGLWKGVCYRLFVQGVPKELIRREFKFDSLKEINDIKKEYEYEFNNEYRISSPDYSSRIRLKILRPFVIDLIKRGLSDMAATQSLNMQANDMSQKSIERHIRYVREKIVIR